MLTSTTIRPLGARAARRVAVLLLALAPVLAVTGCSTADPAPTVASLPPITATSPASVGATGTAGTPADTSTGGTTGTTGTPGDAPTSADRPGERPQFRLDDTDERRAALVNAYSQCLIDHGASKGVGRQAGPGPASGGAAGTGTPLIVVADPVPAAASAACADKLPLMPPEVEAATNPNFHAQSQAYVACMRGRGLWVQLLDNQDLDWTYVADHPVPADSGQIEHECLLKAFS